MLQYTLNLRLLRNIIHAAIGTPEHETNDDSVDTIRLTSDITSRDNGLLVLYRGRRGTVLETQELHRDTWDSLLCEGVPVSVREITHLVAHFLGVPSNLIDSQKLLTCSWSLGWHVTSISDGTSRHYWGGGVTPNTTSNYLRGDWIEIQGTDRHNNCTTSRLARIICGVQVRDDGNVIIPPLIPAEIPDDVWQSPDNKKSRTLVFLLVRYAQPHPHVGRSRGPQHRPLCPGLLQETHCLWSWAKRPVGFQRGCLQGRSWERNKRLFGTTEVTQEIRKTAEERAWYDIIQPNEILRYANVQADPDRNDSFLQSIMWV